MSLRVLSAGVFSLIVDGGRPRTRSLGVPLGGAADRLALALGNALVGNPPDAPGLEMTLAGPTLEALAPVAGVVAGAPFDLASDRRPLAPWRTFSLRAGEVLRAGGASSGVRAYLCVPGGFGGPSVLGSRSALAPARAGDVLECAPSALPSRSPARELLAPWEPGRGPTVLRCLPGAEIGWFVADEFINCGFTVHTESDRMGLRLDGGRLARPDRELASEPAAPGTVQVTNDGRCVVLGVDAQTIGGYPKIAQVIRADLDLIGRLRPGARVGFRLVGGDEAEAAGRRSAGWRRPLARLRAAAGGA